MLQQHWDNVERFPVNSVVRYKGNKALLTGLTGIVTGHSHTGAVNVRFGQYHPIPCSPETLIPLPKASPKEDTRKLEEYRGETPKADDGVKQPNHYMLFDTVEAIEVIARSMTVEAFRGYCLGNILKYRLRAGKKSELATMEKDLKKADFYKELFEKHKGLCHDAAK